MKKALLSVAASALALAPGAALAQWSGGAPQTAASTYCASRQAGNSHEKADRDARWMLANSLGGSFTSDMATILTSGRQMMQAAGYVARQMCPEYFSSYAAPGQQVELAPATQIPPAPQTGKAKAFLF
jgi:hypothetical protein